MQAYNIYIYNSGTFCTLKRSEYSHTFQTSVLNGATVKIIVFCDVTIGILVDMWYFRGTCCLHHEGRSILRKPTRLHGVTSLKTVIITVTVVRTSNLTQSYCYLPFTLSHDCHIGTVVHSQLLWYVRMRNLQWQNIHMKFHLKSVINVLQASTVGWDVKACIQKHIQVSNSKPVPLE